MSGTELAAAIRADSTLHSTRLLMLTSSGSGRAAAAAAGIDGFVTKPARQGRLRDEITRVLNPTAPPDGSPRRRRTDHGPAVALSRRPAVLVVDDVPVNQQVARGLLEKRGCRVDLAANGRTWKRRFDCRRRLAFIQAVNRRVGVVDRHAGFHE